jgi:hypothetical protein
MKLNILIGATLLLVIAVICALTPSGQPPRRSAAEANSNDELADWPEYLNPLFEASARNELAGQPVAAFRNVLDKSDERIVHPDGLIEYVYRNRVTGNAEGPCRFRIVVDEQCDPPAIVSSEVQCPEW